MSASVTLQTVSFVIAAMALMFSLWQARSAAGQSREAAKQASAAAYSVKQAAAQTLLHHGTDFAFQGLADNPQLLTWFLGSRGMPEGTHDVHQRYMFIWVRLDVHQASFRAARQNALDQEEWEEWLRTIEMDVQLPEFPTVWKCVKNLYSGAFVQLIDKMLGGAGEPALATELIRDVASQEVERRSRNS